jgi:hypothetical protein
MGCLCTAALLAGGCRVVVQQLYRISTMYWDDKYNTETVSSEVS